MPISDTCKCSYCSTPFSISLNCCPHCAQPGLYPNVRIAEHPKERLALNQRYENALKHAATQGYEPQLRNFENALEETKSVINRSLLDVNKLVSNDKQLYSSYYNLIDGGVKLPDNDQWDCFRRVIDETLFPNFKEEICFAVLSLDGKGLFNYGDCSIVLREDMIAHRTSVFHENSVMFILARNIKVSELNKLPKGYRAIWGERAKLCISKLYDKISKSITANDYTCLLLKEGADSSKDEFVEVHIYGSISRYTLEKIIVKKPKKGADRVILRRLMEMLSPIGVAVEEF